jgi:hypothetical protein
MPDLVTQSWRFAVYGSKEPVNPGNNCGIGGLDWAPGSNAGGWAYQGSPANLKRCTKCVACTAGASRRDKPACSGDYRYETTIFCSKAVAVLKMSADTYCSPRDRTLCAKTDSKCR